jgi:hypothetical protein
MIGGYTTGDFREMLFDVTKMSDEDFLFTFPELQNYSEFRIKKIPKLLDKNKMFKYVCLCYDKNSPYAKSYPSLVKRKKQVARDLGLIKKTIPENMEEVFLGQNHIVNGLIIGVGKLLHDVDYTILCTYTDKIYSSLYLLRNSLDIDKDLNQAIVTWGLEVDKLEKKMLEEDTSMKLNNELLKRVMEDNMGITPEEQAQTNSEV